jgi:hypothetical protein
MQQLRCVTCGPNSAAAAGVLCGRFWDCPKKTPLPPPPPPRPTDPRFPADRFPLSNGRSPPLKVGGCLEAHHNMQCKEWGWALLPLFLLSGSINGMRLLTKVRKDDFGEMAIWGKPLLKSLKPRTFTTSSWDLFRAIPNDDCRPDNTPMPISTPPVQNEDCSSATRGGRPRMFDMKEWFTRPGV